MELDKENCGTEEIRTKIQDIVCSAEHSIEQHSIEILDGMVCIIVEYFIRHIILRNGHHTTLFMVQKINVGQIKEVMSFQNSIPCPPRLQYARHTYFIKRDGNEEYFFIIQQFAFIYFRFHFIDLVTNVTLYLRRVFR